MGKRARLEVADGDDKPQAFLASFPNHIPPQAEDSEQRSSLKIKAYKRKSRHILRVENDKFDYAGENAFSSAKYVVGVYDKNSKTVKLVPAVNNSKFPLLQLQKGRNSVQQSKTLADREQRLAAKNNLIETFGSKKSKSAARSKAANVVDEGMLEKSNVLEKNLSEKAAAVKSQPEQVTKVSHPPFDLKATDPSGVYPIHKMISNNDLALLDATEYVKLAKKDSQIASLRATNKLPEFIIDSLKRVRSIQETSTREMQSRLLQYLNLLLKVYKMPPVINKKVDELVEELGVPRPLVFKLLKEFADKSGKRYTRPQVKRDKLLMYILVVCLTLEDFTMSPAAICRDLGMTIDKVVPYFLELGCKRSKKGTKRKVKAEDEEEEEKVVKTASTGDVVYLEAPVVFPGPRRSRGGN